MPPLAISRSAFDALGKRLRRPSVSEGDWVLLQEVLDSYQGALDVVQDRLSHLGLTSTSRVKSTGTLIDKLNRGTSFKSVQDIAGARIVVDGGLAQQDAVVGRILAAHGPEAKVVDRRSAPNHGYRAVHVIVVEEGLPVEIQVRTTAQDVWAQTMERLADRWGRGIRYGEPLAGADIEIVPEVTRGDLLGFLDRVGEVVAQFEEFQRERNIDEVAFTELEAATAEMLDAITTLFDRIDDALG